MSIFTPIRLEELNKLHLTTLLQVRSSKRYKQKELARLMDVTPQRLNEWLKGRAPIPTNRLEQLKGFLEIEDDELQRVELPPIHKSALDNKLAVDMIGFIRYFVEHIDDTDWAERDDSKFAKVRNALEDMLEAYHREEAEKFINYIDEDKLANL